MYMYNIHMHFHFLKQRKVKLFSTFFKKKFDNTNRYTIF